MKKHLSLLSLVLALMTLLPRVAEAQVSEYFSIRSSWSGAKTTVTFNGNPQTNIEYSTDKVNWTPITETTEIATYNKTYFRGTNPNGFSKSKTDYVSFITSGTSQTYYLEGNIMSLVSGSNFASDYSTIPGDYCFYSLFTNKADQSSGYHAVYWEAGDLSLPADNLTKYCYASMFERTYIKTPPQLPAQHLAEYCYYKMFYTCISLNMQTSYPAKPIEYILPAEELVPHCYEHMFGVYNNNPTMYQYITMMATSLQDRCGNDIENCLKEMFYFGVALNSASAKNVRYFLQLFFTDWGDVSQNTCPTYNWFGGNYNAAYNYFFYDGNLPWEVSKIAAGKAGVRSQFPTGAYSCETNNCTSFWEPAEYGYLTFDCKTNGGTWESDCDYNEDLRRVVRSDYKAKTVPAAPVKAGEAFKGWYTQPSGGTKVEEATILNQTTAQTYYAQFGEGDDNGGNGGNGGEGGDEGDDNQTSYTLNLSTGVLDFPQYTTYSYTSKFAVIGETEKMTIRLQFDGNILQAVSDYKDFATSLSAADSYVEMKDGTRRAVTYAQKASLLYYGDYLRAAHLTAVFYDADNRTYNLDIYTNELLNYATFEQDYRYTYYKTTLPIESSWVNGRKFQYNETNHLPGDENHAELNEANRYWRYFYGSSSPFDYCQILINFVVDESKTGIPTGYYPINSTLKPGTVFIGSIPCGDNAEIARSNNRNYACGGDASWIMHYYEDEYGIPTKDNWLLRGGYVQIVNKDGSYYMHVHATTDATRTNGESSNNVLDFTVGDESLADELPGPDDNSGEGGEGGDDPETPIVSQDENVNVYQNVSKTTTKILYNLDMRQGKDGLWYKPVDLGTGIAWADRNVGATQVGDVGAYFRWGGIIPGGDNRDNTFRTNYCYDVYGTGIIDGEDLPATADAATQIMGDWRIPTVDEWIEIRDNTDYSRGYYTNQSDIDQFISLPASGEYVVDYYSNVCSLYAPEDRWYWSSTLSGLGIRENEYYGQMPENAASTAYYYYDNGSSDYNVYKDGYIIYGMPVRAVYTPPFVTYTLTIRVGKYEYRYICQTGQKVTVTAIATEEGSVFVRWDEDGLTDAVRTFTMNGDMTYTAVFTEPETPAAEDANVTVYQSVTKSTMKILYDLSPKQGKDGLWYTPVDLGYGVAWADRNVGASSPTAVGSYFYWGGTKARTSFSSSNRYVQNSMNSGYVLPSDADAATVNMGDVWRMPTDDELVDLKNKTVIGSDNGTFTNADDNTLSVFLPATGIYGGTSTMQLDTWYYTYMLSFSDPVLRSTNYRFYWSSVLYRTTHTQTGDELYLPWSLNNTPKGYQVNVFSYSENQQDMDGDGIPQEYNMDYFGMPVRALYVPPFEVCTLTVNVEGYQYVYLCQQGQNVTVTAVANDGYEFDKWTEDGNTEAVRTFNVSSNMTYTATFKQAVREYNIIYMDKGGAAFSGVHATGYPTKHTYGTATTLLSATKDGYTFKGWHLDINCTDGAISTLGATTYTSDITLYALWEEVKPDEPDDPVNDDELNIILYEDKEPDYYTDFSNKYNGRKAKTVTYNRQFTQSKWATLCLPMDVNTALLSVLKLKSRVYEFKYTKGDEESGLTLYFGQAKTLVAGRGYIVNANATLAAKDQFVFTNVVIDTEVDINSGFNIENLQGYNTQGDVYIVGTLRTGLLVGSLTGNRYMGLKDNKIYYPNADEGTRLLAYRGIFRSSVDINSPRVRIVVEDADGEQVSELEVINGELKETDSARKYVQDGILYIERDGRRYTAQGALAD